jgi:soluble lytic murein transglycosylase
MTLHRSLPLLLCATLAAALGGVTMPVAAQNGARSNGNAASAANAAASDIAVEAREALRRRDGARLQALRDQAIAQRHTLASWVDYWEIGNRLDRAQQPELDAFYARWPGTYVEDRLRNDWLLELGKRRDWANFVREFPRFRMNDDREVTCYALLTEHQAAVEAGKAAARLKARAFDAWAAQRDLDDGCALMATTLYEAHVFNADDAWRRARLAAEANRPRVVRAAAALAAPTLAAQVANALDRPALYLNAGATVVNRAQSEVATIALIRVAANEPEVAAQLMADRWQQRLPRDLSAWAWSQVARSAAQRLLPEAATHYRAAWAEAERAHAGAGTLATGWSDDTLAWAVRAALRSGQGSERWSAVQRAIDQMSPAEQRDSTWRYWNARALRETAAPAAAGERQRAQAMLLMHELSGELHFYGKLAAEDLGRRFAVPPRPLPLAEDERDAARSNAGLARALQLIALGLRNEGVREWNFSLRGMDDRALLAAADRACEREVWDRCINTSDRTRREIDLEQRFPMPFRNDVVAQARELGLDPAYVYGLIRQESRFVMDARSHVGASGLMQIMPATARWTARKIGLPFTPELITDRGTNLKLGTHYLKLVLDDFDGSQAMAAAAYNAGPSRPRRWREGATIEPAIWAENIPFAETRDYVKKVLSNATVYAALLAGRKQSPAALPPPAPLASVPVGPASAVIPVALQAASAAASGAASGAQATDAAAESAASAASGAELQASAVAMVSGAPAPASASASSPASAPASAAAPPNEPAALVTSPPPPPPPPLLLPSLKARLGAMIGPRDASAPPPDKELP